MTKNYLGNRSIYTTDFIWVSSRAKIKQVWRPIAKKNTSILRENSKSESFRISDKILLACFDSQLDHSLENLWLSWYRKTFSYHFSFELHLEHLNVTIFEKSLLKKFTLIKQSIVYKPSLYLTQTFQNRKINHWTFNTGKKPKKHYNSTTGKGDK